MPQSKTLQLCYDSGMLVQHGKSFQQEALTTELLRFFISFPLQLTNRSVESQRFKYFLLEAISIDTAHLLVVALHDRKLFATALTAAHRVIQQCILSCHRVLHSPCMLPLLVQMCANLGLEDE